MKEAAELFAWTICIISVIREVYEILEVILLSTWHEYNCQQVGIILYDFTWKLLLQILLSKPVLVRSHCFLSSTATLLC